MSWDTRRAHAGAKALITAYPTPRALREALNREGFRLLPSSVRRLPWNPGVTIGDVLTSVAFRPCDVAPLHALLTQAAQEVEV